mmetsp:Transcript_27331/g.31847  ORF Transcript_27331/g.31847 Transcript_27331/m.31847 type:complete len:344 (+) Transcript_27331:221-1252(+)
MFRHNHSSSTSSGKSGSDVKMEDCSERRASGLLKRSSYSGASTDVLQFRGCAADIKRANRILDIVERQKWDLLIRQLKNKSNAKLAHEIRDTSGLSLLSLALTSDAPVKVIRALLAISPLVAVQTDQYGATPLHLACLNGVSSEVVSLICSLDEGKSASMVDHNNYTVLHHAVEHACLAIQQRYENQSDYGSYEMSSEESVEDDLNCIKVIKILCEVAPDQIYVRNKDNDDTPLDIPSVVLYEIGPHFSPKGQARIRAIHQIMRNISIKMYSKNRRMWERDGYRPIDFTIKSTCSRSAPSLTPSVMSDSIKSSTTGGTSKIQAWHTIDKQLSITSETDNMSQT